MDTDKYWILTTLDTDEYYDTDKDWILTTLGTDEDYNTDKHWILTALNTSHLDIVGLLLLKNSWQILFHNTKHQFY